MKTQKQKIGKLGENLAISFLKKKGYKIVETNWHCKYGEIDIIAKDKDTLVFVEVKARTSQEFGLPQEAVDTWKLGKLMKTIDLYIANHKNLPENFRIDVVAIELDSKSEVVDIELFQNVTG